MMHAALRGIAGADGGLERSSSQPRIDRAADGVTYDPTGPRIKGDSHVHEAGRDGDIGDVSYPKLVGAIQSHGRRKVGADRIVVIAVCRRDEPPARLRIERMFAHQPADLLGVHHKATMTKLSVDTPIAISFELIANRLYLRNDGCIVRACVGPIVKSRARNSH